MPPLNSFEKTLIAVALSQAAMSSHADTIVVSQSCTLADAIRSANQSIAVGGCAAGSVGVDTIELPMRKTISLTAIEIDGAAGGSPGGLPLIDSNITIEGNGSTIEREVHSAPAFRLFGLAEDAVLTLNSITLKNGAASNGAGGYGGAVYMESGGRLYINDSTLVGNNSDGYGGAIYAYGSERIDINRSKLTENSAEYKGGAIAASWASSSGSAELNIVDSLLSSNSTGINQGGALSFYRGDSMVIANSTISNNTATGGGGIYLNAGKLTLVNATISDNHNYGANGGLSISGNPTNPPTVTLVNSVIANSTNGVGDDVDCTSNFTTSSNVTAMSSWVGNFDTSCAANGPTPGGITEGDPGLGPLVDNGGFTYTHAPLVTSGLLGAGDGTACTTAPVNSQDQRGLPRNTACDIGAFEAQIVSTITVSSELDGSGNCTLRDAIMTANSGSAVGDCSSPTAYTNSSEIVFDSLAFPLNSANIITLSSALPTITSPLSIAGQGLGGLTIDANRTARVLSVSNTSVNLSELTLTGGVTGALGSGGGLYLIRSSASLSNSDVFGNSAAYSGGGIHAYQSSVSVSNTSISNNEAENGGGISGTFYSKLTVLNSTVSGNSSTDATRIGGGVYLFLSDANLDNSTVSGNSAAKNGGGIAVRTSSGVSLINSTVSSNSAANVGGGIYARSSGRVSLNNSLVAGNVASNFVELQSTLNSSFTSNSSLLGNNSLTTAQAFYAAFTPDASDIIATSDGAQPTDLLSILKPLAENGGPTLTHALSVRSPAIDAADDVTCSAAPINNFDQRGENRLSGQGCDIGAFEAQETSQFFVVPLPNGRVITFSL